MTGCARNWRETAMDLEQQLPAARSIMIQLTYDLDRIDRQLTTTILLDGLEQVTEPGARATLASLLGRRNDDARVRAVLEKISSSDEDPKLREIASNALKATARH
jgi:hypothetical protein